MAVGSTRATKALDAAGVPYQTLVYEVSEAVGDGYGEAVAAALGIPPARVFKTLVVEADTQAVVAIIPVTERLSTKALARVAGAKRGTLASPVVAQRLTGYVVGGVSPFGQRRVLPTFLDQSALAHDEIAVSGGRRGLQVLVSPSDLVTLLRGVTASLGV